MWGDYDNFTEDDWQIEKIYSGLFVNFVKIGNPTYMGQDWKPWKRKDKNYFLIGTIFITDIILELTVKRVLLSKTNCFFVCNLQILTRS